VIGAFARSVHERQSAADYDYNHDKDGQYWAVHLNLPAAAETFKAETFPVTRARVSRPNPRIGSRSFRRTKRFERADPSDAQTIPVQ
jgi:hypothetical protein